MLLGATLIVALGDETVAYGAPVSLKGSDTLVRVTNDILALCSSAAGITYVGGGSGAGQIAMVSSTQQISPMSRQLSGSACDSTKGAQELLIGLDGLAILGANQVAGDSVETIVGGANVASDDCRDAILGGKSVAVADCSVAGTACDSGIVLGPGTYTFTGWRDVLGMVYGGQNHSVAPQLNADSTRNPARISCAGPVRQSLVNNWGTLFSDTGAALTCRTGTCTRLKHAFRLGDLSDVTDTFVQLVGLVPIPPFTTTFLPLPLGFPTRDGSAAANPFCNSGSAPMNKGDSDYLDLDPIRRIADAGSAGSGRIGLEQVAQGYLAPASPPAVLGNDTRPDPTPRELSDYGASKRQNVGPDPNITNWASLQKAELVQRKGLGLVLPIEIPSNFSDEGIAYWSSSSTAGQPPVPCDPGVVALSLPGPAPYGMCPDGTSEPCLFPVHKDPVTQAVTFKCIVTNSLPVKSPLRDNRVYNLLVLNAAGKYVTDGYLNPNLPLAANRQARVVSGYFRLHASQSTNFGGTPTFLGTPGASVCKGLVAADQIGCLVKANPCSIGITARDALDNSQNVAYRLGNLPAANDAYPPSIARISNLLTSGTGYYPLARTLWVGAYVGLGNVTNTSEQSLLSCMGNGGSTSNIDATMTARKFAAVPAGISRVRNCPVAIEVDDHNPCTTDSFNTATGVVTHTLLTAGTSCSDGNACNGAETCSSSGVCQAGTPVAIDDQNPCTADGCNPSTGAVIHSVLPAGASCSDGNPCNGAETCSAAGGCQPGTPPALNDSNPCTTDGCDPAVGVTHVAVTDGTTCSDGNACTVSDTCQGGVCSPGLPIVCTSDACNNAGACDPGTGKCSTATPLPDGTSCDDGDRCTSQDTCQAGACVAGFADNTCRGPAAALAGRIQSPPAGRIAVAITGTASVGHDGSASYRIPIWVPEGVRGMQPELAIQYDSRGGFGILGPHWQIAGLSEITRCPQTLAHDGQRAPVSYGGDTMCLDGQRLIRVNAGSSNPFFEYRTERNPFAKIIGNQDNAGLVNFEVYQPDGRIFYYGRRFESRTESRALTLPGPTFPSVRYGFYLDKILDRFGNSILINYRPLDDIQMPLSVVPVLVPDSIQWGGVGDTAGARSVTFSYKPYNALDLRHAGYVSGVGLAAGPWLDHLTISGPDGLGGTPALKHYNFSYSPVRLNETGENVLLSIEECDGGNAACKRQTSVHWESGSWDYVRTDLGVTDVGLPGQGAALANIYRRIIPADLNHDGLDDIMYRAYIPASAGGTCLGYAARLANRQAGTENVSFGEAIPLPIGTDPAGSCLTTGSGLWPYSGDPILADLNQDDFPDLILPLGNDGATMQFSVPTTPVMTSYRAYINQHIGPPDSRPLLFGAAFTFEDPTEVDINNNPRIAVGDLDGDGLPEVLRPTVPGGIWAATIWSRSLRAPSPIRRNTNAGVCRTFILEDLDGDGRAEIVCRQPSGPTKVVSPTMNFDLNLGVSNASPQAPVWFLDLNGDGLQDVAYPVGNTVVTAINQGAAFGTGATTTPLPGFQIGQSWVDGFESGVRIADFNGDGRQDLILVGNGANTSGIALRDQISVLISDGAGGFGFQAAGIVLGDPAGGARAADLTPTTVPQATGYGTSVVLDLNGDTLPDVLQLEGGHLIAYIRQGKAPDVVKEIDEGTGRTITFGYGPLRDRDAGLASTSGSSDCQTDVEFLGCVVRGRWVVTSLETSGLEDATHAVTATESFSYSQGRMSRQGEGFLGFKQRVISGPASSRLTTYTYDPSGRFKPGAGYVHPNAFLPLSIEVDVDDAFVPTDVTLHQTFTGVGHALLFSENTPAMFPGTFVALPDFFQERTFDCPGAVPGSHTCSDGTLLSIREDRFGYDLYGNVTFHSTDFRNPAGGPSLEYDREDIAYRPADLTTWRVRRLDSDTRSSTTPTESVTRAVKYTEDPTTNPVTNLPTGEIASVEIEPAGDATTHLLHTFNRDARGRISSASEKAMGTGEVRTSRFLYENPGGSYDSDAVYATTLIYPPTDVATLSQRIWRHPGLGLVVETDDPNNLIETNSFDTFGRLQSQTATNGASVSVSYLDAEDPLVAGGVDFSVLPEGRSTRQVNVHLDSFGRETARDEPIDATRRLARTTTFDFLGRPTYLSVASLEGGMTTILNEEQRSFDDLNRLHQRCKRRSSDGGSYCDTNQFDGLTVIATDASGRAVTRIADSMGRPYMQQAFVEGATSSATFTYHPFGLLSHEGVEDLSGATDVAYDTLGRPTSLKRTGAGTRGVEYNAFGDVMKSFRSTANNTLETLTMARDRLGRLISMTSPGYALGSGAPAGLARTYYWDLGVNSGGTGRVVTPNGRGQIVDVKDANNQTSVHFDYDTNGMAKKKTWAIFNPAEGGAETWVTTSTFDEQGRIDTLTYPMVPGEAAPLAIKYGYDQYLGGQSSVKDITDQSSPIIWSISSRNQRGEPTTENLSFAGAAMTRAMTYYLEDGRLHTGILTGANGQAQETFTYERDGLASTSAMSSTSGTWTATFGYDNLKRLTSWQPDVTAPTVAYHYDSDGNLKSRVWSSETVVYGYTFAAVGQRTVSVTRNSLTTVDTYAVDGFGRVFNTPAVAVLHTDDDQLGAVTEKAGGQLDTLVYDGTGRRVLTVFGTAGAGGSLLTLDDVFRLKRDTSATEGRCQVRANGRLVGEIVRNGGQSRTATFFLSDPVGSVVAEAGSAGGGTITARGPRDPFGNFTSTSMPYLASEPFGSDSDGTSRLAFAGHERDKGWGIVDMVARAYSPRLGRFLMPDAGFFGSPWERRNHNAFAYAWNNPTSLTDPSGHSANETDEYEEGSGYSGVDAMITATGSSDSEGRGGSGSSDGEGQGPEDGGPGSMSDPEGTIAESTRAAGDAAHTAAVNANPNGKAAKDTPMNTGVSPEGTAMTTSTGDSGTGSGGGSGPAGGVGKSGSGTAAKSGKSPVATRGGSNTSGLPLPAGANRNLGYQVCGPACDVATKIVQRLEPYAEPIIDEGLAEAAALGAGLAALAHEVYDWVNSPMEMAKAPGEAKAPGIPTATDGFTPAKGWDGESTVKDPNGAGRGYPDADGRVWVPTGPGPKAHGGPHWDVQIPGGKYINVYPGGKAR